MAEKATIKMERQQTASRKEVAAWLSGLAKAVAAGGSGEVEIAGTTVSFDITDEVLLEVEVGADGDELQLEIELKWSTAPASAEAPGPSAAPRAAAGRRAPAR
ncbi:amphi-Trp domain-containing protein [Pilimelia columellifera]|uniref:Amphi-Trp domain-containing protein n=1 Tax=Pilimelia columellifera subsp. columellifera TaxID=706583 RepID=A0ABN3NKE9_9ACTN